MKTENNNDIEYVYIPYALGENGQIYISKEFAATSDKEIARQNQIKFQNQIKEYENFKR